MASIQTQTTSFKLECWQAVHNLTADTLKIALYTNAAQLDQATTAYSATSEVVAAGYTAGGQALTGCVLGYSGATAYFNCANPTWNASITARYALIYNASKSNKSVAVLDFGSDKVSASVFTITMPVNAATSALLRSSNQG
jgi:hypothetical protein